MKFTGLLMLWLITTSVYSHPLSVSYAEFNLSGQTLDAVYRLPMDDMDLLLGLDSDLDETVSPSEITEAMESINVYIQEHITVQLNNSVMGNSIISMGTWLDSDDFPYLEVAIEYQAEELIDYAKIQLRFLSDLYPVHRTLASLNSGDIKAVVKIDCVVNTGSQIFAC